MKFIDDSMIEPKKQALVPLLSALVSYIAGFIPDWTGVSFSTPDQVLLSSSIFVTFILLDILWVMAVSANHQMRQVELWKIREKGDQEIANIRACFAEISKRAYGQRDLFVAHFERELGELEHRIKEVADKGTLRVTGHHFLSMENVLEVFQHEQEPIWRCTWHMSEGEKLFPDLPGRRYFEQTAEMLRKGSIKEIRVVFVTESAEVMKCARFLKLLDYFATQDGRECRLVTKTDYELLCKDNAIPVHLCDIGIYGESLMFLTEQEEPEISGVFTKDKKDITYYKRFVESMWSESVSVPNPSTATVKVTPRNCFASTQTMWLSLSNRHEQDRLPSRRAGDVQESE